MKLLIGDDCPACDKVKEYLETNSISIDLVHEVSREGRDFIRDYRVMGKPCLLVDGETYFEDDIYTKLGN